MRIKLLIFVLSACAVQAVMTMTGGWSPVESTNSETFQKILRFATEKISLAQESRYKMKPIEVLSAKQQVVAGINYKIKYRIGTTVCKIDENVDIEKCDLEKCGAVYECTVKVWHRSWLNDTQLTKNSCDIEEDSCTAEKRKKRDNY